MNAAAQEQLLKPDEVAGLLAISVRKLKAMVQRGQIPHLRLGHRTLRFRRTEILNWLSKKEKQPFAYLYEP